MRRRILKFKIARMWILSCCAALIVLSVSYAQIPEAIQIQNAHIAAQNKPVNSSSMDIGWETIAGVGVVLGLLFVFQKVSPKKLAP